MKAAIQLMLLLAVVSTSVGSQQSGRISTVVASEYVGRVATVCGRVVTFSCDAPEFTTFLDLDTPHWRPTFTVAIRRPDRAKFGIGLEDTYGSRAVCVTGTIERNGTGSRIVATDPAQVTLANPPEELRDSNERPHRPCDDGVQLPRPTRSVKPQYTAAAMRAKVQGRTLLQGVVGTDGRVHDADVVYSLDRTFGLDEEALKAFRQWRFEPGKYHGQPAAVAVTMEMSFTLGSR